MRSTRPARLLGLLTAGYGAFALARPGSLAAQAELGERSAPPAAARLLSSTYGVRDLVSGLGMLLAPPGAGLLTAVAARVAFDVGDAAALAAVPPRVPARRRLAAIALGWGVLCAASGRLAGTGHGGPR